MKRTRTGLVVRTLRGRLLVLLLAATVIGLLGMGLTSVALLKRSLVSKVDDRLMSMSGGLELYFAWPARDRKQALRSELR